MGSTEIILLFVLFSYFHVFAASSVRRTLLSSTSVSLQRNGLGDQLVSYEHIAHGGGSGSGGSTGQNGNHGESGAQGGTAVIPVYAAAGAANNNHHHHSAAANNNNNLGLGGLGLTTFLATLFLALPL